MQARYHTEITTQALEQHFSPAALRTIIAANLGQDGLRGQTGHPEFHFDESCFAGGEAYMQQQRQLAIEALQQDRAEPAWQAFGRLIHAAQDFYAHSNYVRLWLAKHEAPEQPATEAIDPLDAAILNDPALTSGRLYYPWEVLSFVPGLMALMQRLLPADSHARMNLDAPQRSPLFAYACAAARKRSQHEFERLTGLLDEQALAQFTDR
ncbi:MAG: hypothetical protein AB1894_00855 [Chloroflexota bacterium]